MRAPAWAGDKEKKVLRGDDAWEELNMTAVENMFKGQKEYEGQQYRSQFRCV